jgi:hypothetical protein
MLYFSLLNHMVLTKTISVCFELLVFADVLAGDSAALQSPVS